MLLQTSLWLLKYQHQFLRHMLSLFVKFQNSCILKNLQLKVKRVRFTFISITCILNGHRGVMGTIRYISMSDVVLLVPNTQRTLSFSTKASELSSNLHLFLISSRLASTEEQRASSIYYACSRAWSCPMVYINCNTCERSISFAKKY